MSLKDTTKPSQSDTLTFEFELRHAPTKVWRALTDPVLLNEWLLPVVGFKLELGASFTFNAPPQPGWDGQVQCRVLEIEPMRKLRYAWQVGETLDTVVTFTLEATATGSLLRLEQSGFKPTQKQNFGGARYGWRMMGDRLVELLERE